MVERDARLHAEILRSSRTMRLWAAGLRDRGERARAAARATRAHEDTADVFTAPVDAPYGCSVLETTDPELPSLGDVRLTELFAILVDQHGFAVVDAVRSLATGLLMAGYPMDYDRVSAADAFDILEWSLRDR